MLTDLVAIAAGGMSGALLRFSLANAVYRWLGRGFPYGTLAVNLLGSFLLGLFAEALTGLWRPLVVTGFLGAFTTFSTFSLETFYLIEQGRLLRAVVNLTGSILLGIAAAWCGLVTGRWLFLEKGFALPGIGWPLPLLLHTLANGVAAFVVGLVLETAFERLKPSLEYRATVTVLAIGATATVSSLILFADLLRADFAFHDSLTFLVGVFSVNLLVCAAAIWGGFSSARHL